MEIIRRTEIGPPDSFYTNGGDRATRDVFHVSFDPTTESIDTVIVESVAALKNTEPNELEPLYNAVNPDALQDLIRPGEETRSTANHIQFHYEGLEVRVSSDGDLWLQWI